MSSIAKTTTRSKKTKCLGPVQVIRPRLAAKPCSVRRRQVLEDRIKRKRQHAGLGETVECPADCGCSDISKDPQTAAPALTCCIAGVKAGSRNRIFDDAIFQTGMSP
jgi:hypothetical protein